MPPPPRIRNVLVTGGAGYIGSHTCKALALAGIRPVTLDNLSTGHRWAVRWGPLEEVDLLDRDSICDVMKKHEVDSVIHFAARTYVGDSVRDPLFYYRSNVLTTMNLLEAMHTCEVRRLIFSSSCAVYGDPQRLPLSEDHPFAPVSPYGQTKLDCESLIRWCAGAFPLQWMALRYFNASGADPDGEIGEDHQPESHLLPRAILAAMGVGPGLEVFGTDYPSKDGTAIRDYVHVADLADAHVKALLVLAEGGVSRAVNVGTGQGYTVREVIDAVQHASGLQVPNRDAPRRAGDPPALVADGALAKSALRWEPRICDIQEIARTAWAWHSRHHARE